VIIKSHKILQIFWDVASVKDQCMVNRSGYKWSHRTLLTATELISNTDTINPDTNYWHTYGFEARQTPVIAGKSAHCRRDCKATTAIKLFPQQKTVKLNSQT